MKIFNKFCFLSLIMVGAACTFARTEAHPYRFNEHYKSAAIVPLFTTYVERDGVLQLRKECLLYVKKNVNGIELIADASTKRSARDEDSAETAAWAFFYKQHKYASVSELAQALRTSATKIHMGNHITYFLKFEADELSDLYVVNPNFCGTCNCQCTCQCYRYSVSEYAPKDTNVVMIDRDDLNKALNFGYRQRRAAGSARDIYVHDAFGHLRTILDKFLIGLTDNYSRIKHLFV